MVDEDRDSDDGVDLERDLNSREAGMSDFDIMLLRKKEEKSRRRKRRDIDIINDNDDLIAQLLQNMRTAAEVSVLCNIFTTLKFIFNTFYYMTGRQRVDKTK